jgi:hypothetical protein
MLNIDVEGEKLDGRLDSDHTYTYIQGKTNDCFSSKYIQPGWHYEHG